MDLNTQSWICILHTVLRQIFQQLKENPLVPLSHLLCICRYFLYLQGNFVSLKIFFLYLWRCFQRISPIPKIQENKGRLSGSVQRKCEMNRLWNHLHKMAEERINRKGFMWNKSQSQVSTDKKSFTQSLTRLICCIYEENICVELCNSIKSKVLVRSECFSSPHSMSTHSTRSLRKLHAHYQLVNVPHC